MPRQKLEVIKLLITATEPVKTKHVLERFPNFTRKDSSCIPTNLQF